MSKILIVTGCPRSGTTLLMKLLNTHGKFCIANEINLLSIYQGTSDHVRRKHNKNSGLTRELSQREKCPENANHDYIPDPSIVIPEVLKAYCLASKPERGNFKYLGDKFPRAYTNTFPAVLSSLAGEEFASMTLVHVTRSPIEVINSVCRRIENTKLGLDSWSAIATLEQAVAEWKLAWNARKMLYPRIPFEKVLDLNYHCLVSDPLGSSQKIASELGVDNSFNYEIVSNDPIEWRISQSQRVKIASYFPSAMLCDDWQKFGLFLDRQTFVFK